jgi:arsenate reductase (thioredoxin)
MFILGLQGSPRKGGNTYTLLAAYMEKAAGAGAAVRTIQVPKAGVVACIGCGYCENHGTCVFADDPMSTEIYVLLRQADVVVAASPVFFYGVSSQLKGLIDRCQTLWSRKYIYKLQDPLASTRKGLLLSVGASRGRQLFDGIHLTARYFFDAIDAEFTHALTYRGVESKGAINQKKSLAADIDAAIEKTVRPLVDRQKVLFVSEAGACRAPMAAAIAQRRLGERIRADYGALSPAAKFSQPMVQAMQRVGVDMGFRKPAAIEAAFFGTPADRLIVIGNRIGKTPLPGVKTETWPLPAPPTTDADAMDRLRSEIEIRVDSLLQSR